MRARDGARKTVGTQPTGDVCTVTEGSGKVASAIVANVAVDCEESTGRGRIRGKRLTNTPVREIVSVLE